MLLLKAGFLLKTVNWYNDVNRDLKIEYLWAENDKDYEKFAKASRKSDKPKLDIVIEEKEYFYKCAGRSRKKYLD